MLLTTPYEADRESLQPTDCEARLLTEWGTANEGKRRDPCEHPEIVAAVRRVPAGDPVLSPGRHPAVGGACGGRRRRRQAAARRSATLAEREREVAIAVGQGRPNAEIASTLYMSVPTVEPRVLRIPATLGLNNRVQIALLAQDAGLPEEDRPGKSP